MAIPLWFRKIWAFRNTLAIFLTPLVLLPIPIALPGTESACGYTILWMAIYWITEAVPLGVTAFIPLIVFPLSGIMTGGDVSSTYFKDTTWLFIGGILIAISVEVTGLHKRIALRVLLIVGAKPRCLMIGFMITTFFLSMWISNTATTAMMLPIVEAVFRELKADELRRFKRLHGIKFDETEWKGDDTEVQQSVKGADVETGIESTSFHANPAFETNSESIQYALSGDGANATDVKFENGRVTESYEKPLETEEEMNQRMDNLIKGITLCVPYSASIGGTSTLTGTSPNLILSGQYKIIFPGVEQELSFGTWLIYCLPGACVLLVLAYIWLSWYFLGFNFGEIYSCMRGQTQETEGEKNAKNVIKTEYKKLGAIQWRETTVLLLFTLTALLWFFRDPGFMPGWSILFKEGYATDGTVAMTMSFLLFILPNERPSLLRKISEEDKGKIRRPVPPILDWPTVHKKFPWDILFLLCGGFALADGATISGFSQWMGNQLAFLDGLVTWAICLVVTIIVCIFTECSSNTATASLFVPILAQLAQTIEVHPLYLMLPPVLASSLAFMLPVATPPNAIAFSYGHVKVLDLIKAGWMMNLLGILVISIFINTYGMAFFDLEQFPAWARAGDEEATTAAYNTSFTPCLVYSTV